MNLLQKDIKVLRKTIKSKEGKYEYGLFIHDRHRRSLITDDEWTHVSVYIANDRTAIFWSFVTSPSQFSEIEINDPDTFLVEITNS